MVEHGLKLVAAKGDSDPQAGVALLDGLRPLTVDTRELDKSRLTLLRKWVAADPANLQALTALAALLEQQDQLAEAKKLLLPMKDKLGDGDGARVLGTVLAREGDDDGAYALLWPYVKGRLDTLHSAEKNADTTVHDLWERETKLLEDGKGPPGFIEKYNASGEDDRHAMVQEHMNKRIKADPAYTSAQATLERAQEVVPVALELGMVMLHRAQAQTSPEARKKQLESAEHVFLAIQGAAGETDEYRLYLGQVYYWLGKQAEGKKLFDDLLAAKGRAYSALMGIAVRLRDLGADPDARVLAEEAYNHASKPEEKYAAASLRSMLQKDADDEIDWLTKASPANPMTKARLATAQGYKAVREGKDAEAALQFRAALDIYATLPRDETSLNDSALACLALFEVTGDRETLDKGIDCFRQAVNLKPGDPVLLFNAAVTLENAALADVIGKEIDLKALREVGSTSLLGYLYHDEAGHDAFAKRVREHPGIAKALSYLDKVMLLSPKHVRAYAGAYDIYHFTRDNAALATLAQRLAAADLDKSDSAARHKEFLDGSRDAKSKANLEAAIKRMEDVVNAVRANGGATAAVAMDNYADALIVADVYTNASDPAKILKLAEDAKRAAPSASTAGTLLAAQLFSAGKELRRSEPVFATMYEKYGRSVGLNYVIAVAASEPGPLQQRVLANESVQKAIALLREDAKPFPHERSAYEWALLKNADAAEAEKVAVAIRNNPRTQVEQSIGTLMHSTTGSAALDTYWLMQILGTPEKGREALREAIAAGNALPIDPH